MSTTTLTSFRRHVNAAAGIYARLDRGLAGGRNSGATDTALAHHVGEATRLLAAACADPTATLPDYLDSPRGARLAAAWNRVERRHAGLVA